MLLCKDCKYCDLIPVRNAGVDFSKCRHPAAQEPVIVSVVTGELSPPDPRYCTAARGEHYGECKPQGLLFEARRDA